MKRIFTRIYPIRSDILQPQMRLLATQTWVLDLEELALKWYTEDHGAILFSEELLEENMN